MKFFLNPSKDKLKSKAIESVISRVINISEINPAITHEKFCTELENEF